MGKTYRGEKGPGHEYWSREYNGEGKWINRPGKTTKKLVNKRDRRKTKYKLRNKGDIDA